MFTLMSILLSTLKYTDMSFWERLWDLFKTYPLMCLFGLLFCLLGVVVVWGSFKYDPWKTDTGRHKRNNMFPY